MHLLFIATGMNSGEVVEIKISMKSGNGSSQVVSPRTLLASSPAEGKPSGGVYEE